VWRRFTREGLTRSDENSADICTKAPGTNIFHSIVEDLMALLESGHERRWGTGHDAGSF
jgi:hypothetical protein